MVQEGFKVGDKVWINNRLRTIGIIEKIIPQILGMQITYQVKILESIELEEGSIYDFFSHNLILVKEEGV